MGCCSTPTIEMKILHPKASVPAYGTDGAAAVDLVAAIDAPVTIAPGETVLIPTGVAVNMQDRNLAAYLYPRSGLGHKQGLVLGNGTGLIDSDYQGEIKVSAFNRNPAVLWGKSGAYPNKDKEVTINPGDRIAQLVFAKVVHPVAVKVDDFSSATDRGAGGFGSTGVSG